MVKYKLIKKFPSYLKFLGYLQEVNNFGTFIHNGMEIKPENHPEFWEKVIEKDYEILDKEYVPGQRIPKIGRSKSEIEDEYNRCYKIKSIKRLKDGEVFTVGDNIKYNGNPPNPIRKIKEFEIKDNNELSVYFKEPEPSKYQGGFSLNLLKKYKKPLFISEDGVDIFDPEQIMYIANQNFRITCHRAKELHSKENAATQKCYWFSSEEAAQEYINKNKPQYSEKDMLDFGRSVCDRFCNQNWQVNSFLKTWKLKNDK